MYKFYKGNSQKGEIEIVEPVSIFKNQYAEIFNDRVLFPSGSEGTYIRVESSSKMSVAILPVTNRGKVVVIKTFRHGIRGWGYEVPKGGVKVGEDISVAALRELLEETGYISEKLIYVGEYCDSPAIISGKVKCYLAPESYKISEKMCEKTEAILDVLEFDAKEFLGVQHQMDFIDALTELLV